MPDRKHPRFLAGDMALAEAVFLRWSLGDDAHGIDEFDRMDLGQHRLAKCGSNAEWLQQLFPRVRHPPVLDVENIR